MHSCIVHHHLEQRKQQTQTFLGKEIRPNSEMNDMLRLSTDFIIP
jgi:hypothetical protein